MEKIPTPKIETPLEEIPNPLESKAFDLSSNKNNNYEITITNNIKYITFIGARKDTFKTESFYLKKNIENLKQNKYFLMFDNLKEIYDEIINLMNNNNPILIEDECHKILLKLPISTTKIKEIIFEMEAKEKTDKEKIIELYSIINNMKSSYDKQISELNYKINELYSYKEEQDKKINELKSIIEKNNNINKIIDSNIFNDSLIINKNKKYISCLKKWISPNDIFFKTKLLFRKSNNGDSYEEFHRLCDNKGKTLVLIQALEGFIIGGYTTKDWNTSGRWDKDEKSFLFSLTKGQIFPIIKNADKAILRDKDIGPWFAYIGFNDTGKGNLSQGKYIYKPKEKILFENFNEIIPNEKCNRFFDVKELEIYKIDIY